MKTLQMISLLAFFFLSGLQLNAQTTEATFKVWGNCGMCKKTIEKAATKAGAETASWDADSKMLAVKYTGESSMLETIQKAVAAAGYDNDKFRGDDKAYSNLHDCCQYERKEIIAPEPGKTACGMECCEKAGCCKSTDKCCADKTCMKKGGCCNKEKCKKMANCDKKDCADGHKNCSKACAKKCSNKK